MIVRRVLAAWLVMGVIAGARGSEPVRLILDTDICGDCDDVLALGVIHALESRGQCRLLAVTVSVNQPLAPRFVDAVNTFYGRSAIPVGVCAPGGVVERSKYLGLVNERRPDGGLRFPHRLDPARAVGSVALLRRVLAAQPDRSVVVVQVGFFTNLAALLRSPGDAACPLTGRELVARKVRLLSLMAGSFAPVPGKEPYLEYNIIKDIQSARILAEEWPTPKIYSGIEIGVALPYPAVSIERDYGYVADHPLAAAYRLYNPPPHNRPTWDLTSVLAAVLPDRGYFELSPRGRVTIDAQGASHYQADPQGQDQYLILRESEKPRVLEALVQLASQPPCRR